jgi:RHS repeat-associated protein
MMTKIYLGNYELENIISGTSAGTTRKIHYLSGAILVTTNGVDKLYYSYSDYQGSLVALTNEDGTVAERYAYDPWGVRANPDRWEERDTRTSWIVNRGYTGHEHLDAFGVIDMNGRVYDPFTALFMSPDPYVQSPSDWLNYNRYSYCLNNPFKYTDPSGEVAVVDDILIGMAIAAAIYQAGATAGLHGFSTKDFLQTVVIGGVSAAATCGIGEIFGGVGSMADGSFSVLRELGRATAHGIVQGGLSVAGGGSFGSGFVSGAFSSMAGALAAGSGIEFIQTGFGHAMIASATGGIASVIAGGDFFQGAVSGLFVSLFNQGEKHGGELSDEGLEFIAKNESFKPIYNDSQGYATCGYGHLLHYSPYTHEDVIKYGKMTKAEGLRLLKQDIQNVVRYVNSRVKVNLTQSQFDAVVSFEFNVGPKGFKKSNFLKELNKGNYNGNLMLGYKKPASIIPRRQREVNLFNNGTY